MEGLHHGAMTAHYQDGWLAPKAHSKVTTAAVNSFRRAGFSHSNAFVMNPGSYKQMQNASGYEETECALSGTKTRPSCFLQRLKFTLRRAFIQVSDAF